MSLSIIIINYNSRDLIVECINSAIEFNNGINAEWIIVDNSPSAEDSTFFIHKFPNIKYFALPQNEGFGRANNFGAMNATGDILLFLNGDCLFTDDSLTLCYTRFIASTHIACGISLRYENGSFQNSGHNFFPLGLNNLLPIPYYGYFLKLISGVLNTKRPSILHPEPEQPVDWVNGAFMMVKKDVFHIVKGFDPDFFLYAEEIELFSRLKKLGTTVVYGDLQAIHLEGRSINQATDSTDLSYQNLFEFKGRQLILSNLLRVRKQYGKAAVLFHLVNYWISVPFYIVCFSVNALFRWSTHREEYLKMKGYIFNILSLTEYIPKLLKNKPYFYKVL